MALLSVAPSECVTVKPCVRGQSNSWAASHDFLNLDVTPGAPTKLPSAAVTMRRENWQKQKDTDKPGLAFGEFPAWLKAWHELPPIRRAYALTGLLTGARPGELSRTPWDNLDTKARTLTIGNSKAGNDIPIPIARALKLARAAADKSGLIFPGCEQAGHREALPARGHALRRTYKTVATDCGVSDDLSAFLLGHIPEGMSAKYALRRMSLDGPMLWRKQREISRRVLNLLGGDPTCGDVSGRQYWLRRHRPTLQLCSLVTLRFSGLSRPLRHARSRQQPNTTRTKGPHWPPPKTTLPRATEKRFEG
jgi:integrase